MLLMDIFVRGSARSWSFWSLSLAMDRARSTGMEVNKDLPVTSNEPMILSLATACCWIFWANSELFFTEKLNGFKIIVSVKPLSRYVSSSWLPLLYFYKVFDLSLFYISPPPGECNTFTSPSFFLCWLWVSMHAGQDVPRSQGPPRGREDHGNEVEQSSSRNLLPPPSSSPLKPARAGALVFSLFPPLIRLPRPLYACQTELKNDCACDQFARENWGWQGETIATYKWNGGIFEKMKSAEGF